MFCSQEHQLIEITQAFAIAIPAGTSCTGTINGESNLCLVKVSNNNAAGPFGGVFAVQMSNTTSTKRVKRSNKFGKLAGNGF